MEALVGINGLVLALQRYRLSRDWLQREALAGRLPCLKVGRHLLFNPQAVIDALARRAAVATASGEEAAHAAP